MKAKKPMFLLSIMIVLSLLASACSGSQQQAGGNNGQTEGGQKESGANSGGKTVITYWNLFGGGDGEIMNEMVKQFNESHTDIEVKALTQDWGQYYTKLQTAVSGGNAPDVGISHTSKLSELVSLGIVEPLDDYAKLIGMDWDVFNQNMLNATIFDGKHYAAPLDAHPLILYYNKKILRELNLLDDNELPIIEPGPDGFIGFLTKIKEGVPQGVSGMLLSSKGEDPYRVWWALYNQLGGPGLIDESGKKVIINNEQGKKSG